MNDSLTPENGPDTQNPQSNTVSPGASESSDFQVSAPANVLNEDAGDVSVQETGESAAQAVQTIEPAPNYVPYYWGGSIILVLVLSFVILRGMLRPTAVSVQETTTAKAEAVQPKKKHTTKKKSPNKRKKKSSKKKR